MKALVIFYPLKDEEKSNSEQTQSSIMNTLNTVFDSVMGILKGLTVALADKSIISLLPFYVVNIETQIADGVATPFLMYNDTEKQEESTFSDRFKLLKLSPGTSVKIKGKIVNLSLDDDEGLLPDYQGAEDIYNIINAISSAGHSEENLSAQEASKSLLKYILNLVSLNQLSNWAIADKGISLSESVKTKVADMSGSGTTNSGGGAVPSASTPVPAYSKLKKSMLILYFRESSTGTVKSERVTALNKLEDDDNQVVESVFKTSERDIMKAELDDIDADIAAIKLKITALDKAVSAQEIITNETLDPVAQATEQKKLDALIASSNSQKERYKEMLQKLEDKRDNVKRKFIEFEREKIAKDELNNGREYVEDLFGLDELGLPIRYMFIPETEIVSYSENMQLATPEGSFELIIRESPDASTNVAVGDPAIDFVKSLAGKAWGVFTGMPEGGKYDI